VSGECKFDWSLDADHPCFSCVLGEMYHREPIFAGVGDPEQLELIIKRCGPLSNETMPGWRDLPGLPDMEGRNWDKIQVEKPIKETARKYWSYALSIYCRVGLIDQGVRRYRSGFAVRAVNAKSEREVDCFWCFVTSLAMDLSCDGKARRVSHCL
jgi:hypothetical protein